jgi:hypothetical protein
MPASSFNLHVRPDDAVTAKYRTLPDDRHGGWYTEFDIAARGTGTYVDLGLFTVSPEHLRALALAFAKAARHLDVAQLAAAFEAEHPEYCLLCPCEPTDYVTSGHRDGCPYHCEYCTQIAVKQTEQAALLPPCGCPQQIVVDEGHQEGCGVRAGEPV